MIDFIVYVLFLAIGVLFGSFFGWLLMRWLCRRQPGERAKGLLGAAITALLAVFSAAR